MSWNVSLSVGSLDYSYTRAPSLPAASVCMAYGEPAPCLPHSEHECAAWPCLIRRSMGSRAAHAARLALISWVGAQLRWLHRGEAARRLFAAAEGASRLGRIVMKGPRCWKSNGASRTVCVPAWSLVASGWRGKGTVPKERQAPPPSKHLVKSHLAWSAYHGACARDPIKASALIRRGRDVLGQTLKAGGAKEASRWVGSCGGAKHIQNIVGGGGCRGLQRFAL